MRTSTSSSVPTSWSSSTSGQTGACPAGSWHPVVKELAKEMAGKVAFGKLNVDENPRTAARFGIMSIPTFLIFRNGKLVDALVGAMPKQRFKAAIERYLS